MLPGPLYQVRRASDNTTLDVKVKTAGGYADAGAQDKFCAGTTCVFWALYDQSPRGNHLGIGPPGGAHRSEDIPASATADPLSKLNRNLPLLCDSSTGSEEIALC